MVYGGTIAPGYHKGKKLDVVSAFEAWGQKVSGAIDDQDFKDIVMNACPVTRSLWRNVYCKYYGFCYRSNGNDLALQRL